MKNELLVVAQQNGLEENQIKELGDQFTPFWDQVKAIEEQAKALTVTDESQVDNMQKARTFRLQLKNNRVAVENMRKRLKEKALREGKAIDGFANIIKAVIVPIEEHLQRQEDFIEERKRLEAIQRFEKRVLELGKYVADTSVYNLLEMSEAGYQELLGTSRFAHDTRKKEEAKIEADRVAKEQAEAEEKEAMRVENERLKKEADDKAKKDAEAKKAADKIQAEKDAKDKAEREAKEKELEAERTKAKEAQDKLDEIKRAEEKAAKEAKEKQEKEKAELEEKARQAKLAPEKDKLFSYSEQLKSIPAPEGLSLAGQKIVENVEKKLLDLSQYIKDQLKNL